MVTGINQNKGDRLSAYLFLQNINFNGSKFCYFSRDFKPKMFSEDLKINKFKFKNLKTEFHD